MTQQKKVSSTRETLSTVIAGAMVIATAVYWIIQIEGAMEMMKLAAGK
jgi:hypothetical protein